MFDLYLDLSLLLSTAMLKNGGETYRAEECAKNILSAGGADEVEILAFPTGITVMARYSGKTYTRVRSLKVRVNNLGNIDFLNSLSREVSSGRMNPAEAISRINALPEQKDFLKRSVFACFTSAAFTLMFGGNFLEFILAIAVAFIAQLVVAQLKKIGSITFFSNMGGSILTALLARLCLLLLPDINISYIIIGGIMPLLPGLATINAIRDTLYGDLVSGGARGIDALLSAIAIAAGVGLVLAI
ncbi:MAG: hypothetical protein CVU97_03030 [Firmicutes bacterium HGW-Firmicutes-21]|nr:MAG: hypothetical protein CVU97_03030 [Firmicutes bacterium HGW-Firmicutes-21]